ncbi:beta-ketoacyl-ACP synthase [Phormidium sp. CLA17]|uniref:beta-ketoacyl-ACP synthase n=1 Tax=Leptolyngbya sp. Cla-17 TaxID=2803751 RepID=UPI0014925583|nr:beta-ketoacyl-ACP synthase [Leptolyngbya sp. Cla-17]MBM0740102.1 beta-ketoacyl-ACP synthase [Leptolyngbya sp. Cla-17]
MDVVVTGIGLVSALGSLESTWQHLLTGSSGIEYHQPFFDLKPFPAALIETQPIALATLTERVIFAALKDAGLDPPLLDCGVVIGSSRGHQAQWESLARQSVDGHYQDDRLRGWLDTLPNGAAIAAARLLGTRSQVLSPMAACATGLWAIAQAYELVRTGYCDRVVAGAVETPITPLTLTGFRQMGALAQTGAYPFDRHREGLVLGEGGAVLILESAELAQQRQAQPYGQIRGWGFTADGYHTSAPEPNSRAAAIAVQQCLERSDLTPSNIGYIHAHGTATQLNDRNEAALIQQLLPNAPVSSTKGATGHTIGASGALGAAFCLMALKHQQLPPNIGLQHPDFDLDFVTQTRAATVNHALCLSFGFGGQNGAIAFSKQQDHYSTASRAAD